MKKIVLAAAMLAALHPAKAQDIHFSQFYETSVLRNPALTGIFTEDVKAGVAYRNQWSSLGSPFQTMAATAESRFALGREGVDYLTISGMFYTDKAGRAALKTTGFYPSINYNKSLSDPHNSFLSVGFTAGYQQRSFDLSRLTFDNMYQGGTVITAAGPGENLPVNKLSYFDLGAGVSFNSGVGEDNRVVYFLGLSAFHFTQPRATFAAEGEIMNLATRWNSSIGVHITASEIWSLQVHGNLALQGKYQEMLVGGLIRWCRTDPGNIQDFALSGGLFYRLGDALIPTLKVEWSKLSLGLSYDVNTSDLKAATKMRGGLEMTAFFKGFFGRDIHDRKTCPRF
jgi:type IX secretion system PorP/SprF family membrane protein